MIITRAPLRVGLLGGGTDFPDYFMTAPLGGDVISGAIDKYIYVILKKRLDQKLRVSYSVTEIVNDVDELQHELIREAMHMAKIRTGLEIITIGDVHGGTGLGSSGAVTVAALAALYTHIGRRWNPRTLAEDATQLELYDLKKPIGYQDQFISAFGGVKHFTFYANLADEPDVRIRSVPMYLSPFVTENTGLPLDDCFMLFHLGNDFNSSLILEKQKESIEENRDLLDDLSYFARKGMEELKADDIAEFGQLIESSWQRKRQLADGISSNYIETLRKVALAEGAYGCKVCGAGGRGFLLVCCLPKIRQQVAQAMRAFTTELPFRFVHEGVEVLMNMQEGDQHERASE